MGGQGVYVRHLSRELAALGHQVTVFSGQPYPVLDEGVTLEKLPSLDPVQRREPLRRPAHPPMARLDRRPRGRHHVDRRVPRTAHLLAARQPRTPPPSRRVRRRPRQPDPRLGPARRQVRRPAPGHHHPPPHQRRPSHRDRRGQRPAKALQATLVRVRGRCRPASPAAWTPSSCPPSPPPTTSPASSGSTPPPWRSPRWAWTPATSTRAPTWNAPPAASCAPPAPTVPSRASPSCCAPPPKLATERDVTLTIVSKPRPGGPTDRLVDELGLRDRIEFVSGIDDEELGRLISGAQVAVVPSFYEASPCPRSRPWPAAPRSSPATPAPCPRWSAPTATPDAHPPGRPRPPRRRTRLPVRRRRPERERMSAAAWRRVQERFTWKAVAELTAQRYASTITAVKGTTPEGDHRPAPVRARANGA